MVRRQGIHGKSVVTKTKNTSAVFLGIELFFGDLLSGYIFNIAMENPIFQNGKPLFLWAISHGEL